MNKNLLVLTILFLSVSIAKAQIITPSQLFQFLDFFEMKDKRFAYNANDYLMTIDNNWLGQKPATNEHGTTYMWFYFKGRKVMQEGYMLLGGLSNEGTPKESRLVSYSFIDKKLHRQYLKQMEDMEAAEVGKQQSDGGLVSWFNVNGILIGICEYPPGRNGPKRSYDVRMQKSKVD